MIVQFYLGMGLLKIPRWSIGYFMLDFDDASVEAAREHCEQELGKPLPLGERTGFPTFQVLDENGMVIAGG